MPPIQTMSSKENWPKTATVFWPRNRSQKCEGRQSAFTFLAPILCPPGGRFFVTPPCCLALVPSGGFRKAPKGSRRLPEAPGGSQKCPEIARRLPEAPRSSRRLPETPKGYQRLSEALGGSRKVPEAPGRFPEAFGRFWKLSEVPKCSKGTRRLPEAPEGSRKLLEAPGGSQTAPGSSQKLPEAPGGSRKFSEAPRRLPEALLKFPGWNPLVASRGSLVSLGLGRHLLRRPGGSWMEPSLGPSGKASWEKIAWGPSHFFATVSKPGKNCGRFLAPTIIRNM